MFGQMAESIRENGWITKCMVKENTNGEMEEVIVGNTNMTKNMDLVLILGQTVVNMSDNGLIAKDMVRVKSFQQTVH